MSRQVWNDLIDAIHPHSTGLRSDWSLLVILVVAMHVIRFLLSLVPQLILVTVGLFIVRFLGRLCGYPIDVRPSKTTAHAGRS